MTDAQATLMEDNSARASSGDIRTLFILALVLLAVGMLIEMGLRPSLLNSTPYMMVATLVFRDGIVGVSSYLFGGTKTGGDVMRANAAAVIASGPVAEHTQ